MKSNLYVQSQELKTAPLPPLPDMHGVAGPFAGVSGNALLVGGGANFPNGLLWEGGTKVWHDEIYVLPRNASRWLVGFKLPQPLGYGVSFQDDLGVICAGGSDSVRHYDTVYRLTWVHDRIIITRLNSLPEPCANACGAKVGNLAIMAGGETLPNATAATTNLWAADLSKLNPTWNRLPAWPGPARSLAVAASCGGEFFIMGGVGLGAGPDGKPVRTYLNDAYAYSVARKTWRRIADLPHSMVASPSPALQKGSDGFSILGGDDGSKVGFKPIEKHPGFCTDILTYHAGKDLWQKTGSLSAPRATTPAILWDGKTVVPSGEVRPGIRSPEAHAYWYEPEMNTEHDAAGTKH